MAIADFMPAKAEREDDPKIISAPGALDLFPRTPGPKETDEDVLLRALEGQAMEMEAALDDWIVRENSRPPFPHGASNWASEIHHPCKKHLVHCRLDWEKRTALDARAFWRIEEGNDYERRKIKPALMQIGYELTESQKRYELKEFKISGRIDGLAPIKQTFPPPFTALKEVPAEVKTIGPHDWEKTKTIDDIKNHRAWWIRKYPSQLNLYLQMTRKPGGYLILATFGKRPRVVPMLFDPLLAEVDLLMAREVNKHVDAGTYPEPSPWDAQICGMCGFSHLCQPLRSANTTIAISGTEEAELNIYLDAKAEYEEIERRFKDWKARLIGDKKKPGRYYGQTAFVSDIEIRSRLQKRKAFSVAETEFYVTEIERIAP